MDTDIRPKPLAIGIGILVIVVIAVGLTVTSMVTIDAGHRGVLKTFGEVDQTQVYGEGLHFINPVSQTVVSMNVQTLSLSVETAASSHDLQDVQTTVVVNYHINPNEANVIYQKYSENYANNIMIPAIHDAIKGITAEYDVTDLIQKRPKVRDAMEKDVQERLSKFDITLDNFAVTNFAFSPEFTAAIEQKQVAQQQIQTEQNILEKTKVIAQQKIAEASGQAEAIKIINEQLASSHDYLQWMAITKWTGQLPTVTGGAVPFVPIPMGGNTP